MNKENIKTYIILVVILIVFGAIVLIISSNVKKEEENELFNQYNEIALVEDPSEFFAVEKNINKLYQYRSSGYNKELLNLLSKDYISKNNVNASNYEDIYIFDNGAGEFKASEIKVVSNSELYKYFVKGKTYSVGLEDPIALEDVYFIVNRDFSNATFDILPITKEEYGDYISSDKFNFEKIEKKISNTFDYDLLDDKTLSSIYLNYFKNDCFNNPEKLYKNLTDSSDEPQFSDLTSFKEYINNNQSYIRGMEMSRYTVSGNTYKIVDIYGNKLTFTVSGVVNYKVNVSFSAENDEELHE